MEKRRKLVAVLLSFLMVGCAGANLLSNGGFEDGGAGWIDWGVPSWNVWGSSGYHHDDGPRIDALGVKLWWDDTGLWQNFTAVAGVDYALSIQVYNLSASPSTWNGLIRAEFYDASDTKIGDEQLDRFYANSDAQDTWVEIGATATAPTNTAYGRLIFQNADWIEGVGGDLYYDNASVVAVPEPATIAIFSIGCALVIRRKK